LEDTQYPLNWYLPLFSSLSISSRNLQLGNVEEFSMMIQLVASIIEREKE